MTEPLHTHHIGRSTYQGPKENCPGCAKPQSSDALFASFMAAKESLMSDVFDTDHIALISNAVQNGNGGK